MVINTETNNQCADRGVLSSKWDSYITPFPPQATVNILEDRGGDDKIQREQVALGKLYLPVTTVHLRT